MNWKEEAAEKLRKYDAMRTATENIPQELQRLELSARAIRASGAESPRVQTSRNRQEEQLLNNIVHRQELRWALENAKSWVKTTDHALSALSPEDRLVLSRLYVYPEKGALQRLCQDLGVEQSSIYRRRDRALRNFTTALYGTIEN